MPAIAIKQKALGGKGVVLSYVTQPDEFWWRELVPGTKRYIHRLLPNASTLEEALDQCIEAFTKLRQEEAVQAGSEAEQKKTASVGGQRSRNDNSGRFKTRPIHACVEEFLKQEEARVEAGLLKPRTLVNKRQALTKQMLPYLTENGVTHTRQIDNNTFQNYPTWRRAAKSTRKLELIYFGNFLSNYCKRRGLLHPEIDVSELKPTITIKDSEVDANPPLIEPGNWTKVLAAIEQNRRRAAKLSNHRGLYFAKLFYRWCIIIRNSGLRPGVELNQLRWCDVKRENIGRWSKRQQKQVDKWIAVIYVRDSKTGAQRIVPTNGVDTQLIQWKKEQAEYIRKHCPKSQITDQTLIFGNPNNEMKPYTYTRFTKAWLEIINTLEGQLRPYIFSDRNYTIYSLRSTYVCNLIMQGKGIYDVAKLAGHTVAVCEKYYARLSMGTKAKEITSFDYDLQGQRNVETASY